MYFNVEHFTSIIGKVLLWAYRCSDMTVTKREQLNRSMRNDMTTTITLPSSKNILIFLLQENQNFPFIMQVKNVNVLAKYLYYSIDLVC